MNEMMRALDGCLNSRNWHGALFVALSLPDICAKIDTPHVNGSQRRYADWFNRYVSPTYTRTNPSTGQEVVFLSGSDCYALRCAYLHEGTDDISMQRAREVVERFHFIVPPPGFTVHCNMIDTKLQLQVDIFCNDVKDGINRWLNEIENDSDKRSAISNLLTIQLPNPDGSMEI